ncbi:hypothetical protein VTN96DRAFT_8657 [Rasamsonia emersonii]
MLKTKVDRLAHAKANGYKRGAHREKDNVRAENKYSEDSIQPQNRVLEDYKIWASQDSDINKEDCLHEGQPAPDLATIKDFIRYYIFSTQGCSLSANHVFCVVPC